MLPRTSGSSGANIWPGNTACRNAHWAFCGEIFKDETHTFILHVPYRGGGPVMTDLLGNHVPVACITLSAAIEHIHAGTLVPLALISTERLAALNNVPTIVELGHPDIGGAIWSWLAGPKQLPAAMVTRLNQEVRRALQTPELKQRFERDLFLSMDADPTALNAFIAGELKRWTAFFQASGFKPQ